jgi:predicted alpha-1,2-mannosidase
MGIWPSKIPCAEQMKKVLKLAVLPILTFCMSSNGLYAQGKSPADYVNPFIGASTNTEKAGALHGLGKTFPGAATPFGLVQVSPNTITGGDNGPGYSYEHTSIEGFAFTQMSGVGWYGDLGNFLVMPTIGSLRTSSGRADHPGEGYRSRYSKTDEIAGAGYYAATLTDYRIRVEATAAPHCGMLCFTFPESDSSRIQIDLARRVGGTSTEQYVRVVDDRTIQGWMKCTPEGGGWGNGDGHPNYTVYFYAQFSKPLKAFGVWQAKIPDDWSRKREDIESDRYREAAAGAEVKDGCDEQQGKHLGFYSQFKTIDGEKVYLKAGISFVSMEGARKNLEAEIKDFDFEKVKNNARQLWNNASSKIQVEGRDDNTKTAFYTALYHTMIDPRCFTDVDGSYPGGDGEIHRTDAPTKRTIFSGWDVFRSQFPLQTIINPRIVNDMVNSLVELADESGKEYLERWEFLNAYSGCMLGNPAVSVMVDAYNKGIRGFDVQKGYRYAKNSCEKFGNGERGHSLSISSTLEHAYAEWCLAIFADSLGRNDDALTYLGRSQSYKNVFDTTKGWFRPRKADGSWEEWPAEGRLKQDYGCVESNPYQQGWFVPHDIPGLVALMGGREKALADLRDFFSAVPENMTWNNYYNHANEPVHHIPFLFNRLGAPWLTQYWSRQICQRAYHNSVEGLVGNEDVGQMSAWYVLAASGVHPVCPGDTRYEITSPLFDRVSISLDAQYAKGKSFTIVALNNSEKNVYIQSAKLNGAEWNRCWLTHDQLTAGGTLELEMGERPNIGWGIE